MSLSLRFSNNFFKTSSFIIIDFVPNLIYEMLNVEPENRKLFNFLIKLMPNKVCLKKCRPRRYSRPRKSHDDLGEGNNRNI